MFYLNKQAGMLILPLWAGREKSREWLKHFYLFTLNASEAERRRRRRSNTLKRCWRKTWEKKNEYEWGVLWNAVTEIPRRSFLLSLLLLLIFTFFLQLILHFARALSALHCCLPCESMNSQNGRVGERERERGKKVTQRQCKSHFVVNVREWVRDIRDE